MEKSASTMSRMSLGRFGALILAGASIAPIAAPLSAQQKGDIAADGDWPRYARDYAGSRFSPLADITVQNVGDLERAWSFRLRPDGGGSLLAGTVPTVVDGIIYLPLGNAIVSLEAHSGKELWRHEVVKGALARRGITWWQGDDDHAARLFYSSGKGLVALNAETGKIDKSWGEDGQIAFDVAYNYPPTVFRNTIMIGANTAEDPYGVAGNSRAFDARDGSKLWEFNSIPQPGEVGHETWLDDGWKGRSGINMWIWYATADTASGLIYMTLGSPSANYYGADRPGDNLFGNSVVAVDAQTGEYRWHFQTIHHDLWDWDLPAPPVLFDVTVDGESIPALAQTGKPGLMYILNRETGEPIHGVNEHFVASADAPDEYYSPTQPIPVAPRPLSRMSWTIDDVVTPQDTNAEHSAACHALLDSYGGTFFNSGPFTPFFLHEEGDAPRASINMPHNGGSNWGGSAVDPDKGVVYINTTESGSIGWIEKRDPDGDYGRGTATSNQLYDRGSLTGPGAYSSFSASFKDGDGRNVNLPCIRPPWGNLHAVDGNSGEVLWSTPLGTTPQLAPSKQDTGSNNTFGGPMATAGGLVFIGATSDGVFRAFDSATGSQVWSEKLSYSAMTIPVSYRGKDGRQYIAVVASGSAFGPAQRGLNGRPANNERLITWALPKSE